MVTRRCASTVTPRSRYSRVHRNEKPHGKCQLNVLRPVEKEVLQTIPQFVAMFIWPVSEVDQTYVS
jgi:hypothetical protein